MGYWAEFDKHVWQSAKLEKSIVYSELLKKEMQADIGIYIYINGSCIIFVQQEYVNMCLIMHGQWLFNAYIYIHIHITTMV